VLSRVRRWFSRPPAEYDPMWEPVLERDFEQWNWLNDDERKRLRVVLANFVERWRWEPARGFDLTEEMKVVIAAQASLLLLCTARRYG
jgi:Mlc titration factor MtfA (ptsG expression regulator)